MLVAFNISDRFLFFVVFEFKFHQELKSLICDYTFVKSLAVRSGARSGGDEFKT
jgi:hypothetical protein